MEFGGALHGMQYEFSEKIPGGRTEALRVRFSVRSLTDVLLFAGILVVGL